MTCAIIFSILTLAGEQRGRVMSTYDRPPSRQRKRACSCFGAGRAGRAGSAAGREREAKGMLRNPRAGQVQKRCASTMRAFAFICDVMLRNDTGGDEEEQPASGVLSIFSIAFQVLPSWRTVCTSFATVADRPNGECRSRRSPHLPTGCTRTTVGLPRRPRYYFAAMSTLPSNFSCRSR